MKELFVDRRLTGNINVACKFDDGTTRNWTTTKEEVVAHVVGIVEAYEEQGYKLTLRQLHYQLVSRNWIINHQTAYKKLGKILSDMRYSGLVDWNSIEDRGRIPHLPYWVTDIPDALRDTVRHYRLDRQEGQETHIELWTEKDALSGILKRTTEKYHIKLVVNKGYTSDSAIYASYSRFQSKINDGQKVTILYFGDHDPSGLDMVRDIRERIEFMFNNGDSGITDIEDTFEVVPIGLTMKQIKKYKLPPNPTKVTDSRSDSYVKEFGTQCWEVDALNPETLTEVVETNILSRIDLDAYHEVLEQERNDIAKLEKFIKTNK